MCNLWLLLDCGRIASEENHEVRLITADVSRHEFLCCNALIICRDDDLFKGPKKTMDDALLDICCLFECLRTSLSVLEELSVSMVIGPLIFTREDGVETHCSCMGGTRIP